VIKTLLPTPALRGSILWDTDLSPGRARLGLGMVEAVGAQKR
jgi:hypothetical protein